MYNNRVYLEKAQVFRKCCSKFYKILEISPKSSRQIKVIEKLTNSYDFVKRTRKEPSQVLVGPEEEKEITAILRKSNIDFKITHRYNFNSKNADAEGAQEFCYENKSYCFHSHEEINDILDQFQKKFPKYVSVNNAGASYENRTLKTISITNGDGKKNKPIIFIDAGMHAREWLSPAVGLYVIKQLIEKFSENKQLLETHDWIVMPLITLMAMNSHDPIIEIAWTSTDECSITYKGPKPFSEPETAVLRDVLKSYKGRISFYLTLHSNGQCLLYPWGYDVIDAPNKDELEDVAQAGSKAIFNLTGRKYRVGNSAKILYPAAGTSDDFAYHEGARIVITMELPSGEQARFHPPTKDIRKYVEESWVGIKAMASKVIEKYSKIF
uniref:Peptidase M14 domain-containing protein n=1 Tax=Megaselia scalaris TaxID=36166 RepID=T1GN38_MEGSC